MISKASLTTEVISQAESYNGIRAGIAPLKDILKGPSYKAVIADPRGIQLDKVPFDNWPAEAQTVLVLGLNHPEKNPRLDYWERGDTLGNRRLRELSELIKQWLRKKFDLTALPLPYHLEKGGLFLKDAAVLSGMGVIGQNNLLIHPEWGPRVRSSGRFQSGCGFGPAVQGGLHRGRDLRHLDRLLHVPVDDDQGTVAAASFQSCKLHSSCSVYPTL